MGLERYGQLYPLAIEDHLHDQALELRQQSIAAINNAEHQLLNEDVDGAERTLALAEYNRHEERLHKLTDYCVRNGLLALDVTAA